MSQAKFFLIIMLCFSVFSIAVTVLAEDSVIETTEVSAGDLEISDQNLLPDSPFYFLKEWTRAIRIALTFDAITKTELENKFSNEKLIEIKKLVEKGINSETIKKAVERYQESANKIKERAEKIKEKAQQSETVNKFLQKFTNQQVLHEKILLKLEEKVPEAVLEKIREARERHMQRFGEVMQKLEDRDDNILEKIEKALDSDAQDAEIIDRIREGMPKAIRDRVENKMTQMREGVLEKTIEKINNRNRQIEQNGTLCPMLASPGPDFCSNGKIKTEKNDQGCTTKVSCESDAQVACTMEYAPVCGSDGKTYGNKCTARAAGITVALEGECSDVKSCTQDSDCPTIYCIKAPCPQNKCIEGTCKMTETEEQACRQLWWFDNTSRICQQKEFCGLYMYQGLQTFDSEEVCKSGLTQ